MKLLLLLATLWFCGPLCLAATLIDGHIVDAGTGKAVPDSVVTIGQVVVKGDANGRFQISTGAETQAFTLMARAPGYRAAAFPAKGVTEKQETFALIPFVPHALYLSVYGISSKPLREAAFAVIRQGGANALVIDIKSDRGLLTYPSQVALAQKIGARKLTLIPSLAGVVASGHALGIYMIARIVTFKDATLGSARPDLAVHLATGALYHDGEGIAWTDPYQAEVRAYNVAVAVEAAKAGFDEVQFDYVRFPDATAKLKFGGPTDEAGRVSAITNFLKEAHVALAPYNVFEAVDIFGYVGWNLDDTGIGQQLQDLVDVTDYVNPMLYPSGFKFGIPGYKNPMATTDAIYSTVHQTLENCVRRTHANPKRFRPWLQAFRDYAFGGKLFGPTEVSAQIRGAEAAGSDGWMLWNPHNVYSGIGLTDPSERKSQQK